MTTKETKHLLDQPAFSRSFESLPNELIQEVLLQLPINDRLLATSLTAKSFATFLVHSPLFARKHFKHSFSSSRSSCIWCFLHSNGIKRLPQKQISHWDTLPKTYRVAIYKELLSSETCACPTGPRVDARYWALGHETAFVVMNQLLTSPFPSFDPSCNKSRAIRWSALNFDVDTVKLLLKDPRVDPTLCDNEAILSCALNHPLAPSLLSVLLADPRIDPAAIDHLLLRNFSDRGNDGLVCLLLQDFRMKTVLLENQDLLELVLTNGGIAVWKLVLFSSGRMDVVVLRQQVYDKIEHGSQSLDAIIELVIQDGRIDLSEDDCLALQIAVENRRGGVIRLLLADPRINPSALENEAVRIASRIGMVEGVRILMSDPRVDPSAMNNEAIRIASKEGHVDVVRLLLMDARVNSAARENEAIRNAAANGHASVVKLLLLDPRVDPLAGKESALMVASRKNHLSVLDIITIDRRVVPILHRNEAFINATRNQETIQNTRHLVSPQHARPLSHQAVFEKTLMRFLAGNEKEQSDIDSPEGKLIYKCLQLFGILEIDPIRNPGLAFQCICHNWNQLMLI
ncbi:hypothetical protein BDR26DRAFT_868943, partial [Obelidium mucronatum]